nr:hypothetical protein HmN_000739700 [Hymenolepis microstoma]
MLESWRQEEITADLWEMGIYGSSLLNRMSPPSDRLLYVAFFQPQEPSSLLCISSVSWDDDALWSPNWAGKFDLGFSAMNPLHSSPISKFQMQSDCINSHPMASNGLLRIDILRPKGIGHEAGPLTTGLLVCAPPLGSMIRSTLTSTLHRISLDPDFPSTAIFKDETSQVQFVALAVAYFLSVLMFSKYHELPDLFNLLAVCQHETAVADRSPQPHVSPAVWRLGSSLLVLTMVGEIA